MKGENLEMARKTKKTLRSVVKELATPTLASNVLLTRTVAKRKNDIPPDSMPIRAGHCSECNVRIPSGQLQRALAGKTIQCEHCDHVLHVEAG